ncbi:MAG: sulfate adenylyltransferase subunit CysD, partial [Bdellovibrionales bacterium]|nr:sulfate adenylyltransferase subunit CysD [Bdellovibrionales bacterium]
TAAGCEALKTRGLIEGLQHYGIDAALGGARREEEKSRAKERFFSVRSPQGGWDPRKQRLEIGIAFNSRLTKGDSMRVFPLSNWTELDIWRYIKREKIEVSPLYFSTHRKGMESDGMFFEIHPSVEPSHSAVLVQQEVRYRTLGCMPCTGGICSSADTIEKVIGELESLKASERSTRLIDHDSEGSMEKKKRRGYF